MIISNLSKENYKCVSVKLTCKGGVAANDEIVNAMVMLWFKDQKFRDLITGLNNAVKSLAMNPELRVELEKQMAVYEFISRYPTYRPMPGFAEDNDDLFEQTIRGEL